MAEASHEEWLQNANDVFNISLVEPSKTGLKNFATFQPSFTYSIFGEEEQIFGYKGLKINLRYRANDMRPHLKVSYREKYKRADREPDQIKDILDEGYHLPKVAHVTAQDFETSSKQISNDWSPPGTLHKTISSPESTYEIWRASFEDPAIQQLNSRIQIFSKLYIDGASYIGQDLESDSAEQDFSDADRWTFFTLYQKRQHVDDPNKHSYVFMGYSTVYRFFFYHPQTPPQSPTSEWELPKGDFDLNGLPCRTRISQFVILPPFQGKGNGVRLYDTIFEYFYKQPTTYELTVEAPNEAFDDLRDVCDLAFLRKNDEFNKLHIDKSVDVPKKGLVPKLIVGNERIEAIRLEAKIAHRQFYRVLEMHLMSQLPDSVQPSMELDDKAAPTKAERRQLKLWQLFVKQRVYRKNRDALSELELPERIDKLQETVQSIELEYARILAAHDRAISHEPRVLTHNKRKNEESNGEGPSKKARVEDAEDA